MFPVAAAVVVAAAAFAITTAAATTAVDAERPAAVVAAAHGTAAAAAEGTTTMAVDDAEAHCAAPCHRTCPLPPRPLTRRRRPRRETGRCRHHIPCRYRTGL